MWDLHIARIVSFQGEITPFSFRLRIDARLQECPPRKIAPLLHTQSAEKFRLLLVSGYLSRSEPPLEFLVKIDDFALLHAG